MEVNKISEITQEQGEITQEQLDAMKGTEDFGAYTHEFKNGIKYNDKTFKSLTFNFDKLTGNDALAISRELTSNGMAIIPVPAMEPEYLIRVCARACEEPIGHDAFLNMPLKDYSTITARARSFLLRAE